jgi:predicted HicB family RNase H-like nuclease
MTTEYMKEVLRSDEVKKANIEAALLEELSEPEEIIEEPRDKQVLIRVSESQRDQWQEAAEADGLSVSEWLRQMADTRWREIFSCTHPLDQRQVYPWSEFCLKCGVRLR